MKKKYFLYICWIFLGAAFFSNTYAASTSSTQAADSLMALLSGFHSLTADFTQTIRSNKQSMAERNFGKVAIARPSQFRWEVTRPEPQLLITDGRYLWVYQIDLGQATRQTLAKASQNSPAFLLSGSTDNLRSRFTISAWQKGNTSFFRLIPKKDTELFQWVILGFNGAKLGQMRLLDNTGVLSVFYFSNVQLNPVLPAALFKFKAPKGVDVIDNG